MGFFAEHKQKRTSSNCVLCFWQKLVTWNQLALILLNMGTTKWEGKDAFLKRIHNTKCETKWYMTGVSFQTALARWKQVVFVCLTPLLVDNPRKTSILDLCRHSFPTPHHDLQAIWRFYLKDKVCIYAGQLGQSGSLKVNRRLQAVSLALANPNITTVSGCVQSAFV